MAYGAEVQNRTGQTMFGTKHTSLKKIKSGYVGVQFNNSATSTTTNDSSYVSLLGTVAHRGNALIFARPHINPLYGSAEHLRLKGPWPMAVTFHTSNIFRIIAPDDSVHYYDGQRGRSEFAFTRSSHMFQGGQAEASTRLARDNGATGQAICSAYYEVWVVGDSGGDTATPGLQIKTPNGADTVFNSNSEFFAVESSATYPVNLPVSAVAGSSRYEINDDTLLGGSLIMQQTSESGQSEYLALLNGGAHCCAFIVGGSNHRSGTVDTKGYEIPDGNRGAYYRSFVEFHYSGNETSGVSTKGKIVAYPRLAYTKEIYDTHPEIFKSISSMGPNPVLILGRSS